MIRRRTAVAIAAVLASGGLRQSALTRSTIPQRGPSSRHQERYWCLTCWETWHAWSCSVFDFDGSNVSAASLKQWCELNCSNPLHRCPCRLGFVEVADFLVANWPSAARYRLDWISSDSSAVRGACLADRQALSGISVIIVDTKNWTFESDWSKDDLHLRKVLSSQVNCCYLC